MSELHKSKKLLWILAVVFTLIWLYALGIRTLVPPDEGRYAEMAREMWASGDWITLRLNGIKYFEKPPLQTWMNALSFAAFGLGEWQARLWIGLCGLLGVGLTAWAGLKVFGARVALYGALVLGSSFFWVAGAQINSLDMGLSAMMTVALCALLVAQRDDAGKLERRNAMLVCWLGMALAVLAKGLIGIVLPGGVLFFYTLVSRDWKIWARLHLAKGLLLFFAIAAPWFVLIWLRNPEHPYFFFVHEHWDRFFSKGHHRLGAWYYFFQPLLLGAIPWLGVLVQSLLAGARHDAAGSPAAPTFKPKVMLLVWAVFIFCFFSYSSSKLPGYIMPIFPALALLIASYLETASRRQLMLPGAAIALLAAIGLPFAMKVSDLGPASRAMDYAAFEPWVVTACLVMLAAGIGSAVLAKKMRRDLAVLVLAAGGLIATEFVAGGFEPLGQERAGAALAPAILAEAGPATAIYSVGTYEQSLTFYLRRTVTLVDYVDEFGFGLEQQPQLAIADQDSFLRRWTTGPKALAIVRPDIYADYVKHGIPLRVVAQDARRVVIANDLSTHSSKAAP